MHVDVCVNVLEQFTRHVHQQGNEAAVTCPLGKSLSWDTPLLGLVCVRARVGLYVRVCVRACKKHTAQGSEGVRR